MQAIRASSACKAVAIRSTRLATPLPVRIGAPRMVIARAEEDGSKQVAEFTAKAQETFDSVSKPLAAEWEATPEEEKPAAIGIISFAVLAQIAIKATIDSVDKIPIVAPALEFLGIIITGGYAYKYITEPEERSTVQGNIDGFVKAVKGG